MPTEQTETSSGMMSAVYGMTGITLAVGVLSGSGLRAQEPTDAAYYVYVAAESQDQVALVRFGPEGASVERTISASVNPTDIDGPHGIAVAPDGSNWYVSIAHGLPYGRIRKFRTGSDTLMGEVEAGLFPATMAVTPSGLLFAVNFNLHGDPVPSTVSVIETGSMTKIRDIETCAMPHGSRLSPDSKSHYSVCMRDEQLVEIDVPGLEVSRRLYLAPGAERALPAEALRAGDVVEAPAGEGARCGPTWVQPSPDGRRAWVACNRSAEVVEVDLGKWRVARRFATGSGPYNLDVTPDGTQLVVSYKGDQAIGVFDLETGRERATLSTSRRIPHGVAVTPDSRYAFVTVEGVNNEPGTVEVIDLTIPRIVARVDVGRQAGGIGFWTMEPVEE